MTGWSDLAAELDAWGETGATVEFWLRDDDAGAAAPAPWRRRRRIEKKRIRKAGKSFCREKYRETSL